VKYEDIRPSIKSGDLLAWNHKGKGRWNRFLIWLGRLGQLSGWTHVGVAWVVGERVLILDAVSKGVRDYPLSMDLPCYLISRNEPLTDAQLAFALSKKGQKYSYWECFLAWLGRNDKTNEFWECAEFVCAVLGLDCQAVPSAVVDHAMQRGATMTFISN
jgi:hypothetical protein